MSGHSPLSMALRRQIAGELDRAREEIERLGAILCSDPAVTASHMTALQALDMIGQHQMVLAAIVRAPDPQSAIAATPLEALRGRLEQSLTE